MIINAKTGHAADETAEMLVFYMYEDSKKIHETLEPFDVSFNHAISELLKNKEFTAKLNNLRALPTYGKFPSQYILLVGLGKKEDITFDKIRQASGTSVKTARDMGIKKVTSVMDSLEILAERLEEWCQSFTEGAVLGLYQFKKYKQTKPEEEKEVRALTLLVSDKKILTPVKEGIKRGQVIANAVSFARDLVNTPSQDKNPTILSNIAKNIAKEQGVSCKILSTPDLKKLRMGGILGVAQGSTQPPKFIILEYNPQSKNQDTIVIVGKGITFDSGGICLKPAKNMDQMKSDMSGGAAVLGVFSALAKLKVTQRIVGLIPCTENMPGGSAIKPGDIVTFHSGKTAEVANTDAEGRLILADALAYAEKFHPGAVVDFATLTGACVVALGGIATGMLGNNEELKNRIKTAGEKSWERVWELPLWEEYQEFIKSDIADIKNTGGSGAGTITAACFLSKFTEKYPWVHLDIAGTSWAEKNNAYMQKGATGVGVMLMLELLKDWKKFTKEK
ncbi:MAG: leucyl aminopeptidase [Candidatus Kuenenia stuttgartiensis]|nr:leucyl aminopeptidase [Candidatus Kuenenia stuttgartiensis]MCL4726448.1 leucyl aminopeptidase [Candidatus Kuenenia stuttgartiensis]GJQ49883.1 MAG: putative cytosol aminopeptidase [Candidatus Kuenenia stuttgartiensis]